eukprot:2320880-Lingulodinium_polyedra.AAC.1
MDVAIAKEHPSPAAAARHGPNPRALRGGGKPGEQAPREEGARDAALLPGRTTAFGRARERDSAAPAA